MANFNRVILMGNLTADPELRYTKDGTPVCTIQMAINEPPRTLPSGEKKDGEVLFVRVKVWRKQAEPCAEYLKKGRPVLVEGRLRLNQWTAQDGQKRSNLEVVAQRVQFLGGAPTRDRDAAPTAESAEPIPQPPEPEDGNTEDVPF